MNGSNRGLNKPPTRARARERLIIVEFQGFRRVRSPQGMLPECLACCISAAYKKAASVARYGHHVARHVERPSVRSKNTYIAEPVPELQPMCCARLAHRAERSAWSWTSTLEIRPDLENDEIALIWRTTRSR